MSRQKECDADPKATHQIKFVGQLKKLDNNGSATDSVWSIYVCFNNF